MKIRSALVLLASVAIQAQEWKHDDYLKVSAGPAWFEYAWDVRFKTPTEAYGKANVTTQSAFVGGHFGVEGRWNFWRNLVVDAAVDYSRFGHGKSDVIYELFPGESSTVFDTNMRGNSWNTRVGVGIRSFVDCEETIALALLGGYAFRKQQLCCANIIDNIADAAFRNTWQGGYIGGEADFFVREDILMRARYFFTVLNFKSLMNRSAIDDFGILCFKTCAPRLFEHRVSGEALYMICDGWSVGTGVEYSIANNRSCGKLFVPAVVQDQFDITTQRLANLHWQEFYWNFIVSYDF